MDVLERLKPRTYHSWEAGTKYARELGSQVFSTKHFLIGLVREEKPLLAKLLLPFGVEADALGAVVKSMCEKGSGSPVTLKATGELKAALFRAANRADAKNLTEIAPAVILATTIECDPSIFDVLSGFAFDAPAFLTATLAEAGMAVDDIPPAGSTSTEAPPADSGSSSSSGTTQTTPTKPKTTTNLDKYGRDITKLATEGKLATIIGREREIKAVLETLCRPQKNNPMLLGEPGVGKTAIVEGIAQKIVSGETPEMLKGKRLVEISLSGLLAGAGIVGELETRLQAVLKEVQESGNIILFMDEIHALMGMGGVKGQVDPATMLKPALARGELHLIGATTYSEYKRFVEQDEALTRRFAPLMIDEPPRETTMAILATIKPKYEAHFNIIIPDDMLPEAYDLSQDFLRSRYYPDKAIDLLERASSRAMIEGPESGEEKPTLKRVDYLSVLSDMTGLPLDRLTLATTDGRAGLKDYLNNKLPGQGEVIDAVEKVLRLSKLRLDLNPRRPDGVFLAVGPHNCGKENLGEALAGYFFDDDTRVVKFDMAEFQEPHSISRLIGSPPGYIGSDQEGQLTKPVSNKPFTVIQFNNIDRANPSVIELFQQVFDEGRLTDAQGRTVYFTDTTIVMTIDMDTAAGTERSLGFGGMTTVKESTKLTQEQVSEKLKDTLSGDFFESVDEILIFAPLDEAALLANLKATMNLALDRISRMGYKVEVKEEVYQYLLTCKQRAAGDSEKTIRRIIEREILVPLAEEISSSSDSDKCLAISIEGDKIVCNTAESSPPTKKTTQNKKELSTTDCSGTEPPPQEGS